MAKLHTDKNPAVSVIMAVYNGARYIQGAVESVFAQTFRDLEIIVVDDGSTDGTRDILRPWVDEGKIKYIYQENKGLAGARNTGLTAARGIFVKFLDCDDLLYSELLEHQVAHLTDQPRHVISTVDYELEFENNTKRYVYMWLTDPQLAHFITGNPCPAHTVLVRRELVEGAGRFDEQLRSHEDSDLWLRIIMKGGHFEKIEYTGCCYRILNTGLSADSDKMFLNECRFTEKLNRVLNPQLRQLVAKTLYKLYLKNELLIHMCFARNIDPASILPETLKVTVRLERMKKGVFSRFRQFAGTTGLVRKFKREFDIDCVADPANAAKLKALNTLWRDPNFYDNPNFSKVPLMERRVKNVLYYNTTPMVYGAETRLLDIIRRLDKNSYRPYAVIPRDGPLNERLRELNVVVKNLDSRFYISKNPLSKFLELNKAFIRFVREHNIDIIHINLHLHFINYWLALLILRKPLIVHLRSHFYLHLFEKFVMCRAFKVICISKFTEQEFLKERRSTFLMLHRPGQTEIIYDGIDVAHFAPQWTGGKIREELNIPKDDFLVGIIGAVDKVKGHDILLKAADIVLRKHPGVKILIVGELYGTYDSALRFRARLNQMVKDMDLEEHVIFHGFRNDISVLMNELDLLVQPSEREALGTSMVEAMACGKPVIGTKVDGIPEVIGNDEGGKLLDPRTPEKLAELIMSFIENRESENGKWQQRRERVLQRFNVYKSIQRIHQIYEDALNPFYKESDGRQDIRNEQR